MKIELLELNVRDLVEDYSDDGEGGVRGYGGKLGRFYVKGKRKYGRIVIRRRRKGR